MVQLIPTNANPTRAEIDAYIHNSHTTSGGGMADGVTETVRVIHSKSGAGALLHPAEEYFVSRYSAVLEHRNSFDSFVTIDNSMRNPYNTTQ